VRKPTRRDVKWALSQTFAVAKSRYEIGPILGSLGAVAILRDYITSGRLEWPIVIRLVAVAVGLWLLIHIAIFGVMVGRAMIFGVPRTKTEVRAELARLARAGERHMSLITDHARAERGVRSQDWIWAAIEELIEARTRWSYECRDFIRTEPLLGPEYEERFLSQHGLAKREPPFQEPRFFRPQWEGTSRLVDRLWEFYHELKG
jgi:hypothetical protein